MAWITPIPPSPRHPHERYQVCYLDGKRQRSAGIFRTKRRALAEKRAIERGDRDHPQPVPDLDPEKANTLFGEYVTTKWWPAWKDQHPSSEYGTRKKLEKRILPTFGDIPVGELDASTIGAWKAAMVAEQRGSARSRSTRRPSMCSAPTASWSAAVPSTGSSPLRAAPAVMAARSPATTSPGSGNERSARPTPPTCGRSTAGCASTIMPTSALCRPRRGKRVLAGWSPRLGRHNEAGLHHRLLLDQ